jgi:tetratricopeptide (TPR) repeat protein
MIGLWAWWLFFPATTLPAQAAPDSLYEAMRAATDEREKAAQLLALIDERKYTNVDSPRVWAAELLEMGNRLQDPGIESDALAQLAWIYRTYGNHAEGILYAGQATQKAEQIHDRRRIANALLEVGMIQREQTNYPEAEASFLKAFAAYKQENDPLGQGWHVSKRNIPRRGKPISKQECFIPKQTIRAAYWSPKTTSA